MATEHFKEETSETLEERLQELFYRLAAWHLTGEANLTEIFSTARVLLERDLEASDDPLEMDPTMLLRVFEKAIGGFDNILTTMGFGDE